MVDVYILGVQDASENNMINVKIDCFILFNLINQRVREQFINIDNFNFKIFHAKSSFKCERVTG